MPSQKSSKPKSKANATLKVKSLSTLPFSTSQPQHRLDPLTAFSKPNSSQSSLSHVPSPAPSSTPPPQPSTKGKSKGPIEQPDSNALWVDVFRPTTEQHLAVHNRKVDDVRCWLHEAFSGGPSGKLSKYRRVLALTGPAGCGKTSTIEILSHEMDFEITEWRNSTTNYSDPLEDDYDSPIAQFEQFIERAAHSHSVFEPSSSRATSSQSTKKNRIILIEDLPNVLHRPTRDRFHSILHALTSTPPHNPPIPIIIILSDPGNRPLDISDGHASGTWRREDVMDIRTVVPRDLLNGPYVRQIPFNPIAPTLLRKALQGLPAQGPEAHPDLISKVKELVGSKSILDELVRSSSGDIRSAIMSLQFACIVDAPGQNDSDPELEYALAKRKQQRNKSYKTSGKAIIISSDSEEVEVVARPTKRRKKDGGGKPKSKKTNVKTVLEALTQREQALVMFHVVGKVLWNKRWKDPPPPKATAKDLAREAEIDARLKPEPKLSSWLEHEQRRPSRVDVNQLAADSPIDSSLLSLYVQQNYAAYCEDIEECYSISEILSFGDSLSGSSAWQTPIGVDFHLLVLGTHHGLPSPVPRKGQKVFKPEFFEALGKEKEAWEAVRDVRAWLAERGSQNGHASHWTRSEITTELGSLLKAKGSQLPRTHLLFSHLPFTSTAGNSHGQVVGDADADPDDIWQGDGDLREDLEVGGFNVELEDATGWLDSDDIEDC